MNGQRLARRVTTRPSLRVLVMQVAGLLFSAAAQAPTVTWHLEPTGWQHLSELNMDVVTGYRWEHD